MQAIKLQTRITPDHRIELQLPEDTPVTVAEVIVLIRDGAPVSAATSLEALLARLDQSDRPRLPAEVVDRWIDQERRGWE
jgi:sporulation-control protein spo0M